MQVRYQAAPLPDPTSGYHRATRGSIVARLNRCAQPRIVVRSIFGGRALPAQPSLSEQYLSSSPGAEYNQHDTVTTCGIELESGEVCWVDGLQLFSQSRRW